MTRIRLALSFVLAVTLSGCLPKPAKPVFGKQGAGSADGDLNPGPGEGSKETDHGTGAPPGTDAPMGGASTESGTGGGQPKAGGPAVQQSPRFDEITWLTAHNAFVNGEDANWIAKNQSRSLQFQLDNGVTAFMLDIYGDNGQVIMCHGSCATFPPGLYNKMDFIAYLKRIGAFLDQHREAILTVILEDYTGTNELRAALDKVPNFRDRIYDPYKADVRNKGWPRIDAMIKDNKRLLVMSDRPDKKELGIAYAQDFTVENYWSLGRLGNDLVCRTRWDNVSLKRTDAKFAYLFVMNHFRDIPSSEFSAVDNKQDLLWDRINKECIPAAEKKPNYLAVDHFDEADWGARKTVADLNERVVLLYKDSDLRGAMQMLKPGRYHAKDLTIGDNQLSSLKISAKTRVKLYEDDNFQKLLIELTEDSRNLGDKVADKTSSIIVEKE